MTLHDCLVYAREHAHTNIAGRLEIKKAAAEKDIAKSGLMPYLRFSTSGNVSFGRNIDPETNTYDNRQSLSTGFGLYLSLPLFDGLVAVNNLKYAKMAVRRKMTETQIEEDRNSLDVIRAFYNVAYCRAMVAQMASQLRRDSTDLAATKRSEALGTKSGADVAEFEAIVASDEYELTNQRNLLKKAVLDLKGYMGMELTCDSLVLDETSGYKVACETGEHPRIAESRQARELSRLNLRAARGAYSPQISLEAGVSTSYYRMEGTETMTFRDQWRNNMGQYVGLSLSFPIFDGLSTANKVKRASVELRLADEQLATVRYEVEKETAEAALDLEAAFEEFEAADRRVKAEETAYTAMRRKYELGMVSAIELYTSSAKLAQALANREGKRIQRIISGIMLQYCKGAKLI